MRPTLRLLQTVVGRQPSLLPRNQSISFIGLGRMGSEMAYNLFSKSYTAAPRSQFVVCDAVPAAVHNFTRHFLSRFPEARLHVVETPEEAVRMSQTVITMLPSSPQVLTVYSEGAGIIPALHSLHSDGDTRGTLCIDSTTLDVRAARQVAQEVAHAGAVMIDAPVSGGVSGAKAGTLSFLVGGTSDACDLARPFLQQMGERIIHCGPSGSGLVAKICNNLILGVEQIVVGEAMLLGQKAGLDPAVLARVINSSTGGCWASSTNNPVPSALPGKSPPCENGYEGGFATTLMLKDMGLATDVGKAFGVPLPMAEAAKKVYSGAVKQRPDLAQKDFSSVFLLLEEAAKTADPLE